MISFADLIHELGEFLGVDLHAEENQGCSLTINETLKVQIEIEPSGERILLTSMIIELPPGKFRENVLKDGLKANYGADAKQGALSYLERENCLVLHEYLNAHAITRDILYNKLLTFIERANKWLASIEAGRSAPDDEVPSGSDKKGSIFGFK